MRVSEVEEQLLAGQYENAAYNGRVFQSNDDNAIVVRDNIYNFSLPDIRSWSGNNLDARVWWDTESYSPQ